MTTIISRLYPDARTAQTVAGNLRAAGFPAANVSVVHAGADMAAGLAAAHVPDDTAAAYVAHGKDGRAVVVVRAEVTPFGAALKAIGIVDEHESIHVPGADGEAYIRQTARGELFLSVLTDHPRWFTPDIRPGSGLSPGRISDAFGMRILSARRERTSAISGGRFMSKAFWPMPLLSRHKERTSAISGGRYMSRWFWPMALISRRSEG